MSDVPRQPAEGAGGEGEPDDKLIDSEADEFDELPGDDDGEEPPEPETPEEADEGQDQPQVRRPRGRSREATLSRENIELRERLARLEGQVQQPRQQTPQFDPEQQRRAAAERLERLRNMDPIDAILTVEREAQQGLVGYMSQQMMQVRDEADQARWEATCERDRTAARLSSQVEDMVARARQQGTYLPRQMAYAQVYGQEALRRRGQVSQTQRRQGQRRIAAQTTRPGGGGSDVARAAAGQRDQDAADEEFLKNASF